jgi:hypothetical protein
LYCIACAQEGLAASNTAHTMAETKHAAAARFIAFSIRLERCSRLNNRSSLKERAL